MTLPAAAKKAPKRKPRRATLSEEDANRICGIIVCSRLDNTEKARLCAEVRRCEVAS